MRRHAIRQRRPLCRSRQGTHDKHGAAAPHVSTWRLGRLACMPGAGVQGGQLLGSRLGAGAHRRSGQQPTQPYRPALRQPGAAAAPSPRCTAPRSAQPGGRIQHWQPAACRTDPAVPRRLLQAVSACGEAASPQLCRAELCRWGARRTAPWRRLPPPMPGEGMPHPWRWPPCPAC